MNINPSRRSGFLALVTVGLLALGAGCSDEQRRDLGEEDIRQSLTEHVEQVADDQGVELDGDLTCTADIAADSALTASCEGTTSAGAAMTGTFEGTADMATDPEVLHGPPGRPRRPGLRRRRADVDCFTGP